jgi:hypothetical protein
MCCAKKPIALTAAEAELLRTAPKGSLVAEAFMVRHHPQWHEVRRLIREGSLGRIHRPGFLLVSISTTQMMSGVGPNGAVEACSISAFTQLSPHDSFSSANRGAQLRS